MTEPMLVTVLRHGEVEGRAQVFRGRSDPGLTDLGWRQMQLAIDSMQDVRIVEVASSPMRRCREFAEKSAADRAIKLSVIDELSEMDFGAWEGLSWQEARALDSDLFERFSRDPKGLVAPQGEAFDDFCDRVGQGFESWVRAAPRGHRLLISHGGVMRVLLSRFLGFPASNLYRVALPYASSFTLSMIEGEPACLLSLNPTPCAA